MGIAIGTFAASLAMGVVCWAFGIEPRLQRQDQKFIDYQTLQDERWNSIKVLINTRHDATDKRLDRIERGMNGHLPTN